MSRADCALPPPYLAVGTGWDDQVPPNLRRIQRDLHQPEEWVMIKMQKMKNKK